MMCVSMRARVRYEQEVVLNDRLGKKLRVKCNEDDTIGDLKKLVAAQTGTFTGETHPGIHVYLT